MTQQFNPDDPEFVEWNADHINWDEVSSRHWHMRHPWWPEEQHYKRWSFQYALFEDTKS